MRAYTVFACAATLALHVAGYPTQVQQIHERATAPPTSDPFYTPPPGYENSAPGTILASRPVPAPISAFNVVPLPLKAAYQLLYRTSDTFGNPSSTVSTVLVPLAPDYSKLLSYQVAEDASYLNCAPSYALQFAASTRGPFGTSVTQVELLAINAALEQGWIVALPDHEGPKAAFLANTNSGHATLDGIRAVLSSTTITGVLQAATVTMWGYSGGSLASGFAAELQSSYAPELTIAGVALGGTVPNITSSLHSLNKGFAAGLIPGGMLGLAHEYSDLNSLLQSNLKPATAATFNQGQQQCLGANIEQYAFQDILTTYFTDPTVINNPVATEVLAQNMMGQHAPSMAVFLYKSINDEISIVADTDLLFSEYCLGGTRVEYQRDELSEHTILLITGIPSAVAWLTDRFEGVQVAAGCLRDDVATSLLGSGSELLSSDLLAALSSATTLPLTQIVK